MHLVPVVPAFILYTSVCRCKNAHSQACTHIQHMYTHTAHVHIYSTCTHIQHMYTHTAHVHIYSTCTHIQHMYTYTAHVHIYSTCTHIQDTFTRHSMVHYPLLLLVVLVNIVEFQYDTDGKSNYTSYLERTKIHIFIDCVLYWLHSKSVIFFNEALEISV